MGVLALATAASAIEYQWEVYKSPLPGYDNTWLLGLADDGFAHVFVFNQIDADNLYYFDRHGKIETPPPSEGTFSATDIAVGGLMSGTVYNSTSPFDVPALRKRNGELELVSLPQPATNTLGSGISNSGRMVGSYRDFTDPFSYIFRGFFYHGGKTTIYDYPGALYTVLSDVNDSGWATGIAYGSDFYTAFITNGKQSIPLETGLDYYSQFVPRFINNSQTIAGGVFTWTGTEYAEISSIYQNGSLTYLQSPKTWPSTIVQPGFGGYPQTYVYGSSKFVITSLTNKGEVSAMSIATYHDAYNPWFQYTFVESYIGYPVKS